MLRIDSLEFVACALALVIVMRSCSRPRALFGYAAVSCAVYAYACAGWQALLLSAVFVYWPWLWQRARRPLPSAALPWVFAIQTVLLIWSRKYLGAVPLLASQAWVSHAIAIVAASYVILRQVELLLWIDADPEVEVGWVEYTAFTIGLFTLLAGPIPTFRDFRATCAAFPTEDPNEITDALNRIVNGYLKVAVLSRILYDCSSLDWLERTSGAGWAKLTFFYLYPLYVYTNFSGYCDVVIGFGRLVGLRLPENFDHPYLARNIQEYWQRWHITFSSWIRNQIFFPLVRALRGVWSGSPRSSLALSVFITFVLVGLWHGTDPNFVVFGVLHGLAVLAVPLWAAALERVLSAAAKQRYDAHPLSCWLRRAVCYHYLCFTMIFFERPFAATWRLLGFS